MGPIKQRKAVKEISKSLVKGAAEGAIAGAAMSAGKAAGKAVGRDYPLSATPPIKMEKITIDTKLPKSK